MRDLIYRDDLIAAYNAAHKGPPGGAYKLICEAPAVDAVPKELAKMLCKGYLKMPSGCDGCPLCDTMILDKEGNDVCALYQE